MSEKHTFHVMREMTGDKAYAEGDQRALSAVDAAHLVRSGALKPMGEKAIAAMAELLGNEPAKQVETIVQQTAKDDAPNNKAMSNAPANKGGGGRRGASGGKAAAAPAGTAPAAPPAAPAAPAVGNVGQDGGAPATPPPADQGSGEGAGDPPAGEGTGTGDSGPPAAAATTPPPATPRKRR